MRLIQQSCLSRIQKDQKNLLRNSLKASLEDCLSQKKSQEKFVQSTTSLASRNRNSVGVFVVAANVEYDEV